MYSPHTSDFTDEGPWRADLVHGNGGDRSDLAEPIAERARRSLWRKAPAGRPLRIVAGYIALLLVSFGSDRQGMSQEMVQASLVRSTDTSRLDPPSPDPAGIAYLRVSDTLLISDSEVNEKDRIFTGDNLFEMTLSGTILDTSSTLVYTREPTSVAVNPENGHLFFSDDDANRIIRVDPGGDEVFGTADDILGSLDTKAFGSDDPEGLSYDSLEGRLFLVDGDTDKAFVITPGPNGYFDGAAAQGGDDLVTSFDVKSLGIEDPEGIEFNPATGTLFILSSSRGGKLYETTTTGALLREIDISEADPETPAGLALAPSSVNPGILNLYIVDRGRDNANDGRLYELALPAGLGPTITSFDPSRGPELTEVSLYGSNFTGTSEVRFGSTLTDFTFISDTEIRTAAPAGATSAPIRVANTDGAALSPERFLVTVPPAILSFTPGSGGEGAAVRITGSGFIEATSVHFDGLPAAAFTVDSETQIRAIVPPGASTGRIGVTTSIGDSLSTEEFHVLPTRAFTPTDDAHVRSNEPSDNFGSADNLRVKAGTSVYHAYLKFDITGVEPVHSAKLRLFATRLSPDGGAVFRVSNDFQGSENPWTEGDLVWNNAPNLSVSVGDARSVFPGYWAEIDVSEAIAADGIYSFGLSSLDPPGTLYSSKEGPHPPELVVVSGTSTDDNDGDTIADDSDNCPDVFNPDQSDADTDGVGDLCDVCAADPFDDLDSDGLCGDIDNCPGTENPDQADADADGVGDLCDNCPGDPNSDQTDTDGDGVGDACASNTPEFVRGDSNQDMDVNIGDVMFTLSAMYRPEESSTPECWKAADANDDGVLDISDAIFSLLFLFSNGLAIPSPFPDCGPDSTEDDVSCQSFLCGPRKGN